jgi:F0F1-type ATP synthase assembly protein I
MTPNSALDKFRLREIEQQLAADVHAAKELTRLASTDEEKRNSSHAYQQALQLFTDFAARGIVPEEFLRPSRDSR